MRDHNYYVYLLASRRNGTLYVDVTNDLLRRVSEHQNGTAESFTRKYGVHRLVWFEHHGSITAAIQREKRIKKWNRAWKVALIEKDNPNWMDLFWKHKHQIDVQNAVFIAALEKAARESKNDALVR